MDFDPNEAVTFIIKHSTEHAQAKANRVFLEQFRKTKKAQLMNQSSAKTAVDREAYAYAHPEYIEVLEGLKVAVEIEEDLKFKLIAAQLRVDVYRTQSANNRMTDRATQ